MTTTRTALVTGATEGIGRALAFALGRSGFQVGVCARSEPNVDQLLRDLAAAGIRAAGRACDVSNETMVKALVAHVTASLGPVHTLINNAGVLTARPVMELSLAEWDQMFAVNVRGLFLTCRAVLPGMRERGSGDIVNIASLAGRNGFKGGTAYAATKHAVLGFSRSLMLEERTNGIRVLAVCPGSVATPMLANQPMLPVDAGRILQPDDVASTIVAALALPGRALVSELDIRPTNP
jgi:3-oxoacyl-[acyl-carrier protein] reductase